MDKATHRMGAPLRMLLAVAVLFFAGVSLSHLAFAADAPAYEAVRDAYLDAEMDDRPIKNAVFLYHRLSALIWVSVEWIAALVLFLSYRAIITSFPTTKEAD